MRGQIPVSFAALHKKFSGQGVCSIAEQSAIIEIMEARLLLSAAPSPAHPAATKTSPPPAAISAADIVAPTSAGESITIVFAGPKKINASGLQTSALSVSGPVSLPVDSVTLSKNNSVSVTALFVVGPPTGGWAGADDGLYTVALVAGAVKDAAGNSSAAATGSFHVNIPLPPGSIDPEFGDAQAVTIPFVAEAIAAQADGKLLVAGHMGDVASGTSRGVIERLNADGSVDTAFGNDGQIVTAAGNDDAFSSLLLQSDGSIVVAGSTNEADGNTAFLVSRYTSAGQVDTSFGQSGRTTTDFGGDVAVAFAAMQTAAGQTIVAGSSDGRFAFAAFKTNGALDTSFGQSGRQLFGLGSGSNSASVSALAAAPDGDIAAAGTSGNHIVVLQLTASGSADTTFGGSGSVIVPGLSNEQATSDHAAALAIESNGEILVAGGTSAGDFGMARLNSLGTPDATFGMTGLATADFGGAAEANSLLLGGAGQVYAVGQSTNGNTSSIVVADFDSNGNLVTGFGNAGEVQVAPGAGTLPFASATVQDGELAIGGSFSGIGGTGAGSTLLRRIVASASPTTSAAVAATHVFGIVDGKQAVASFTLPDKTVVTLKLAGGTGTASEVNGRLDIAITATGTGGAFSIHATGGSRLVTLDNVTVTGSIRSMNAPAASIAGTLFVTGSIGTLRLAQVDGTIASGAGSIVSLNASSFTNASIFSGVNLGADDEVGGTGANADTYAAGTIGSLDVRGTVADSLIAAGIKPVDGDFLNANDTAIDGASSGIGSIIVKGAVDAATHFAAGSFRRARIPLLADTATDPHFMVRKS